MEWIRFFLQLRYCPKVMRLAFAAGLALLVFAGAARADNPFGVMLWPGNGEDMGLLAARAKGLGAGWFRPPAVFVDRWTSGAPCPACAAPARSGLSVALTVRNGGRDWGSRSPSTPPLDGRAYQAALTDIIETWHPTILVIENEENNPRSYRGGVDGPSAAQAYGRQLALACETAHAQGMGCTNGGLTSEAVAAVTWLALLERGQPDIACNFARKAFYRQDDRDAGTALCAYQSTAAVPDGLRSELLGDAPLFIAIERASPIDRLNLHWFGHDASAFAIAAETLSRLTGKPVMSNEMGLVRWEAEPGFVRPLLRAAFAAQVNPAIWFSLDTANSRSLINEDGSLRPAGQEFLRQMSGRK